MWRPPAVAESLAHRSLQLQESHQRQVQAWPTAPETNVCGGFWEKFGLQAVERLQSAAGHQATYHQKLYLLLWLYCWRWCCSSGCWGKIRLLAHCKICYIRHPSPWPFESCLVWHSGQACHATNPQKVNPLKLLFLPKISSHVRVRMSLTLYM